MKYYKVIKADAYDKQTHYSTILGELLTERERNKYFPTLKSEIFECVNISKSKVYSCFGARFEVED